MLCHPSDPRIYEHCQNSYKKIAISKRFWPERETIMPNIQECELDKIGIPVKPKITINMLQT